MYTKSVIKNYLSDFIYAGKDFFDGTSRSIKAFITENYEVLPNCELVYKDTNRRYNAFNSVEQAKFNVKIKKTDIILYTITIGVFNNRLSQKYSRITFHKLPTSYYSLKSEIPGKKFDYGEYVQKTLEEKKKYHIQSLHNSIASIVRSYVSYRLLDEKEFLKKTELADDIKRLIKVFTYQRNELVREKSETKYSNKALAYILHKAYTNHEIYNINVEISAWNDGEFSVICKEEVKNILKSQIDHYKKLCISDFYNKILSPACGTAIINITLTDVLTGQSVIESEELYY